MAQVEERKSRGKKRRLRRMKVRRERESLESRDERVGIMARDAIKRSLGINYDLSSP